MFPDPDPYYFYKIITSELGSGNLKKQNMFLLKNADSPSDQESR